MVGYQPGVGPTGRQRERELVWAWAYRLDLRTLVVLATGRTNLGRLRALRSENV